ncbi:MAG: hypothetical protein IKB98_01575, partial [Clostridia bacterium]|nr:hypothetical protein [Clostridia bacterium]
MTVKEIIEKSAELLGVELTEGNTENFVRCYNFIENELAMDYFPLRTVDKVLIKDNKIKYDDLQRQAWRIMGVYDCNNKELKYKLYPKYIGFWEKENGKQFLVVYCYMPQEKTIDGISEFDNGMFEKVFKYGVCGEYCLMQGDYETASAFNEKYKKSIQEIYANKKGATMEIKKCPFCGGIGELTMDEKKVIETKLTEYENEQLKLLKSVFDMGCAFKMLALQKEANDWELKYLNGKRDFEYAQEQIGRFIAQVDLLKKELAKKE